MARKTSVQIEFEANITQFNTGIKQMNAEINTQTKALKLNSAQLVDNEDNVELLSQRQDILQKELEASNQKIELTEKSLQEAKDTLGENSKEYQIWSNRVIDAKTQQQKIQNELEKTSQQILQNTTMTSEYEIEIRNADNELKSLSDELELNSLKLKTNKNDVNLLTERQDILHKELELSTEKVDLLNKVLEDSEDELGKNSNEYKELEQQLKDAEKEQQNIKNDIAETTSTLKENRTVLGLTAKKWDETGSRIENTGKKLSILSAGVATLAVGAGKSASDFESAFAGVRKTVDATEQEYKQLSDAALNTSLVKPIDAADVALIMELGGQLGVAKDELEEFANVVADLSVSTDLTDVENASQVIAQFANVTNMSMDDVDKFASTIVDLGNNSATTESKILEMAQRIAGAGTQSGLSQSDILALAASLSSVGIEAESGGTSISAVMARIDKDVAKNSKTLKTWANLTGQSVDEFRKAWEEDAIGTLQKVFVGMSDATKGGDNLNLILDELGVTSLRQSDMMKRMANASEILGESIDTASGAWEENTALTEEARKRYETTESQIHMLKNEVIKLAIEFGEELLPIAKDVVSNAKELIEKFSNLDDQQKRNIIRIAGLVIVAGPLLTIVGKLTRGVGSLIGFGAKLTGTLAGTTSAAAGVTTASATATGAISGLGATIAGAASTIIPAGLLVAGAAVIIKEAYDEMSADCVEDIDVLADKVEGMPGVYDEMGNAMFATTETISDATKEAVGAYLDLDQEARSSLLNLYSAQTVITDEIKKDMTTKTNDMAAQVIAGYENQKTEALNKTQEMLNQVGNLTDEEQQKILEKEAEYYNNKISNVETAQNTIDDIYKKASDEHRSLTSEEYATITTIQNSMQTNAIRALSTQESEANLILERMKVSNTRVTAEIASENIKKFNEQRDAAIDAANQQYLDTVEWARVQRDELGTITDEQYDKIVETAEQQRDDTVAAAEDTRDSAVETMMDMNTDLEDEVDTSTGEIKSKWQQLKDKWAKWKPDVKSFEGNVTLKAAAWSGYLVQTTGHAEGGLAVKPHMAMIAEGGESEAIIPLSKFPSIMSNILKENQVDFSKNYASQINDNIHNAASDALNNAYTSNIDRLINAVHALANRDIHLDINGETFIKATAKDMDNVNGSRIALIERGLAF